MARDPKCRGRHYENSRSFLPRGGDWIPMQIPATFMELYLSPVGEGGQTLSRSLDMRALGEMSAEPALEEPAGPQTFIEPGGDPNQLRDQGWAVIVPQGKAGDRLLALVAPLL